VESEKEEDSDASFEPSKKRAESPDSDILMIAHFDDEGNEIMSSPVPLNLVFTLPQSLIFI
jgi:hypothetical protein